VSAEQSEDEAPYPDEPDFSIDSPVVDRTVAKAQPEPRQPDTDATRSGSQVSLAPSYAPSVMGEYWQMTPKERLGLGSRVRKSEVLPWETTEDLPQEPEMAEGKKKRLSLRLSSKK
jgi:hypothetical protein